MGRNVRPMRFNEGRVAWFQQIAGCKTRVMIKLGLNQGFWSLVFVALPWWWAQTGLLAHTEWYSSDWFRRLENHHQPSKTSTNSTTYPSCAQYQGFCMCTPRKGEVPPGIDFQDGMYICYVITISFMVQMGMGQYLWVHRHQGISSFWMFLDVLGDD